MAVLKDKAICNSVSCCHIPFHTGQATWGFFGSVTEWFEQKWGQIEGDGTGGPAVVQVDARLLVVGLGREGRSWIRSYAVDWMWAKGEEKSRKAKANPGFWVKRTRDGSVCVHASECMYSYLFIFVLCVLVCVLVYICLCMHVCLYAWTCVYIPML